MKTVERNGKKRYEWEAQDEKARAVFEEALAYQESLQFVIEAVLSAAAKRQANSRESWRAVHELIKQIDPEAPDVGGLRYSWILGAFTKE